MQRKAELEGDHESSAAAKAPDQDRLGAQKSGPRGRESVLRKLQRMHGNRFVQRLLKRGTLQRSAAGKQDPENVPPLVQEVLRSQGQPLDASTRELMESRFGQDFSQVKVHTDRRAAESADAVDATAYTVGSDIVFGDGQYAPGTTEGNRIIAHELTHVAQQGGEAGDPQGLTLGPTDSVAEREADAVATAVTHSLAVPQVSGGHDRATIRRTTGGAVAGGIIGGVAGAGLGALGFLGGPILGGILTGVGALLGALIGTVVGEAASTRGRPLHPDERAAATMVFGNSMNLDQIRLAESRIMSTGGYARTLPGTIYFPPGHLTEPMNNMPLLIHEMTHSWQYQHGVSVFTTLFHAIRGRYDYGGEAGLRRARTEGKHFLDFNTEQQADICKDYYVRRTSGQDTSAWDPFIAEVQSNMPRRRR